MAPDALSADRILARCDALAAFSEQPDRLTRVFLSDQHRAAAGQVLAWMREAGMRADMDAAGNCVGRYEGDRPALPALVLGSHLDTVREAGRYDGMLGVVAAIECVEALARRGRRLPYAVEVIGFADEEGTRFGATLIGSRAVAGTLGQEVLDATDASGTSMREAMAAFGLDPSRIGAAARRREDVLAYAELHIEQGPVLEAEGLPVGVVTAINGATRYAVQIDGTAGHAGTVPMALRRDALAAAAECILAVEQICAARAPAVGTVGRVEALPGAVNVVPGRTRFTLDLRTPEDATRESLAEAVRGELAAIAERRRLELALHRTHDNRCAACAPWLVTQVAAAVAAEGLPVRLLSSGAGHDGMAMVDLCDFCMLFVRCRGGVSHHPDEAVIRDDVAVAARVLSRFIENFRAERS